MIRTTLLLDTDLYHELKRRAATEGRTLTEVVEHLLRLGIQAGSRARRGRVRLPSYDLGPFLSSPSERSLFPGAEPAPRHGRGAAHGDEGA
jgi:hypothetical protein